jgi:hypothetical protein
MSSANHKPATNAAQRQGRKKMKVLGALAAITLFTWSRQLFGGEPETKEAVESSSGAAAATASVKSGGTAAKGPKTAKTILNFEQAMERMKQWPEALHRRVIDGPIEDLSPINWMLDPAPSLTDEVEAPEIVVSEPSTERSAPVEQPAVVWTSEHADGSSLGFSLRSTVLFGSKRFAVINGVRYAEGETIVAGSGRYLLASVRSREVLLTSGGRTWILVIRDQSIPSLDPDQAE